MSVGGEGVIYSGARGRLLTGYMARSLAIACSDGRLALLPMAGRPMSLSWLPTRSGAQARWTLKRHITASGSAPAKADLRPATNYAFEQPIVESLMLGNIAIRTQELLEWDAAAFRLTPRIRTGQCITQARDAGAVESGLEAAWSAPIAPQSKSGNA